MSVKKEVIIIGGGPAGMAAAVSLKERGIEEILLLEKENRLGGVLSQCIHDGFGLVYFQKNYSGPEYAAIYEQKIKEQGIPYITEATVSAVQALQEAQYGALVTVQTAEGTMEYEAKAVIVATGCRERGRGAAAIPGSRPAGIYTAGTAQAFINLQNFMPGRKAVIVGSGDIGLIMARRITLEGGQVLCVVEKEAVPGGLRRNVIQCLEDHEIPLRTNTTVSYIYGKERVSGVEISQVDLNGKPIEGSGRYLPCDTVILSVGLIPEDDMVQDQQAGIFLCGNALYVHDLVDDVTLEGKMVAGQVETYLARIASGETPDETRFSFPGIHVMRKKRLELVKRKREFDRKKAESGAKTITCILCPNGCEISDDLNGGMCSKGPEYVKNEILDPRRTLTTSIRVNGGVLPLVSVRTTGAIPKEKLKEAVEMVSQMTLVAPMKLGEIIWKDFIEEGNHLIATKTVEALPSS